MGVSLSEYCNASTYVTRRLIYHRASLICQAKKYPHLTMIPSQSLDGVAEGRAAHLSALHR